jgi:hypothetical protein
MSVSGFAGKCHLEACIPVEKNAPDYAINFQAAFARPNHKRMMGLHPDNQLHGKK